MNTVSTRSQQTSVLPTPATQPAQPPPAPARPSASSRPAAVPVDAFQTAAPTARARVALGGEVLAAAAPAATSVFASNDILQRYQPSGASADTARQDGLSPGVGASNQMADTDRSRLLAHKEKLSAAAQRYGVPPAVLAAIASRESRGGAALDSNGLGDNGNGFGLMQVDKRSHTPAGGPYSQEHINQAASILRSNLDQVRAKHPSWSPEQQMRGAIAAYNFGVSNVQTIGGMDQGTTGNDYSNDVWARALRLSNDFGGRPGAPGTGPITNPPPTPGTPTQAPSLLAVRTTPETFLREGMEGASVRQLQQLLGMPAAAQSGKFDATTRQAVITFQQANGLTPPPGKEGWVGATTLNALEKAAWPADPNTAYTPAPTLEQVRTTPETFLRKGMEGEPVRQLQQLLGLKDEALTGRFDARTDAAVRAFQDSQGLTPPPGKEGWVGATTLSHLEKASGTPPAPTPEGQWTPAPSLAQVRAGSAQLREGMQGEAVRHLQQRLGLPQDGKFGAQTKQAVVDYQRRNGLTPPPGLEGVVGKTTLEHLERAPSAGTVNANHPSLQRLATGHLSNGPTGTCVATTLENMDRLGVANFPGGTAADPNNPRAAMVRMMREAGWVSVPLPGSQQRTIRSPAFGTVTAHVIPADAYERMAQAGQIPSGALIFQTRHGWDYSGGSSGNDMGIVRDNGRVTHNYRSMSPIIYSDAKEVVLLVPRDALQ